MLPMTRRRLFAESLSLGGLWTVTAKVAAAREDGVVLNDVQSQLNATRVGRVVVPKSIDEIAATIRQAGRDRRVISVSGGRHAMGGQQFASDAVHIDMKGFNRVVHLDRANGLIEAEAGIEWPELIAWLEREQRGETEPWAIREKQTGVDRVSLGGSLSANIHGRGLRFPPFVGDIESFVLVGADGEPRRCSRRENPELFSLAIGGYGLFGLSHG